LAAKIRESQPYEENSSPSRDYHQASLPRSKAQMREHGLLALSAAKSQKDQTARGAGVLSDRNNLLRVMEGTES